ncbi:MAG: hypothetical protein LBU32_02790 [Clostridiales bacterium]|nr:hypothetical protein [Clostridiales bacterium]
MGIIRKKKGMDEMNIPMSDNAKVMSKEQVTMTERNPLKISEGDRAAFFVRAIARL